MPVIIVAGTPIDIPSSGQSPNWAPGVIQAFEAIADALSNVVGSFDVVPQKLVLDTAPNDQDVPITNLSFSTTEVRGAQIRYAIYRNSTTTTLSEYGNLFIVYNESAATNEKWQITREYTGDANVEFTVDDTGQVNIVITAISGTDYNAFISYAAQALQNSY